MLFLAEAEAEFEGVKKFGLRPNIEAEAEGDKFYLHCYEFLSPGRGLVNRLVLFLLRVL